MSYIFVWVNSSEPFRKEEVLPLSWYGVNGTTLLEVYSELKDKLGRKYIGFDITEDYCQLAEDRV